jgi:ribulose-phosphate 3-epimerase
MMSIICPTITASDPKQFKTQTDELTKFAKRLHLDIADDWFAPKLLSINQIKLPEVQTDIHVMFEYPGRVIEKLIDLKPNLVIIHFESDANFNEIASMLKASNIKFGIAILQQTDAKVLKQFKDILDHVLIFSGNLGFFGGHVDMGLIHKIDFVKKLDSDIEIGWDGGINLSNAKILSNAGVDVLNVGGYIHKSKDPKSAFDTLVQSIGAKR